MAVRQPARESSFNWPPSGADLAAIDILDVTRSRVALEELAAAIRRPRTTPSAALAPVPMLTLRIPASLVAGGAVGRVARPRRRARVWRMAGAAQAAFRADRLMLLAAGMMVGTALPGVSEEPRATVVQLHAAQASASVASTTEAERLLAMRALLRGEGRRKPAAAPALPAPSKPTAPPMPEMMAAESALPLPEPAGEAPATSATTESPAATTSKVGLVRASTTGSAFVRAPRRRAARRTVVPQDAGATPVLQALNAYQAAWSRMDANATREIWPSASPRALTRTFTSMREQRLSLENCSVEVSGERAAATCPGTLRYRPRVGDHSTRVQQGQWDFQLERSATGWIIRSVDAP